MNLYESGAVTVAAYRVHTGDMTTPGTYVTGALVEAEELLEDELRRDLASEERTESMRVQADGRVYPRAYPITVAEGYVIDGNSLVGAYPDNFPFIGVFERVDVPLATITYTGGFTPATLPRTLAHAIYDLAKVLAQDAAPIPVGATSASVGDVAVGFAKPTAGQLDASVPGLTGRVARYRRRYV